MVRILQNCSPVAFFSALFFIQDFAKRLHACMHVREQSLMTAHYIITNYITSGTRYTTK